jgi:four helix bundle protein
MSCGLIRPDTPPKVTDLLIRQKTEAMIAYAYVALRQFPKWERHVLAAELRQTLWSLLRLIVVCNKRYYKKTTLQDLDAEIDLLRSQVRLAKELGYLDFRKYEHWSKLNDEIGRMIGGWIKAMGGSQAGGGR